MSLDLIGCKHFGQLVGITGKAGAGKDTVGEWLKIHASFETYAMAQPLKAGMAAMGFPEPLNRDLKESKINGFNFTWRDAAQKLGTEWGRDLDPDIWLNLAQQKILDTKNLAITDIRFENEAAMIRANGGLVIHIVGRQAALGEHAAHASEKSLLKHPSDYVLDNSGTEKNLFTELRRIFNE